MSCIIDVSKCQFYGRSFKRSWSKGERGLKVDTGSSTFNSLLIFEMPGYKLNIFNLLGQFTCILILTTLLERMTQVSCCKFLKDKHLHGSKSYFFIVDKYKDHLDRVRRERSQPSSPTNLTNGSISIEQSPPSSYDRSEPVSHDQSWSRSRDQSRPNSTAAFQNGTSWKHLTLSSSNKLDRQVTTYEEDIPKDGYFEGPAKGLDLDTHVQSQPDLLPAASKFLFNVCSTYHILLILFKMPNSTHFDWFLSMIY